MPTTSQLCQLIFDYYRETPADLWKLQPLMHCHITRAWGTLRINCHDQATLNAVKDIYPLWQEPLALLRVSKRVRLLVQGHLQATLTLNELPVLPDR